MTRRLADGAPVVSLNLRGCPAEEEAEVRRLVAIELEADVMAAEAATGFVSTIEVLCDGAYYDIAVTTAAGGLHGDSQPDRGPRRRQVSQDAARR